MAWIEKHRPRSLEEVVGNASVVDIFKSFATLPGMPCLILTGTPGIGKTTLVSCFVHSVIPDAEQRKEGVLEMNASDERGIEVVRSKIKTFLRKKTHTRKILVLDESDAMTLAAQQSMRRLLEHQQGTSFVFICNDISKISETIQSRCVVLSLSKLTVPELEAIVSQVATKESVEIDGECITHIADASNGDARQAINMLQTVSSISNPVQKQVLERMSSTPPLSRVISMVSAASIDQALSEFDKLVMDGYAPVDICKMLLTAAKDQGNMSLLGKASGLLARLPDTASPIQFYTLLLQHFSQD